MSTHHHHHINAKDGQIDPISYVIQGGSSLGVGFIFFSSILATYENAIDILKSKERFRGDGGDSSILLPRTGTQRGVVVKTRSLEGSDTRRRMVAAVALLDLIISDVRERQQRRTELDLAVLKYEATRIAKEYIRRHFGTQTREHIDELTLTWEKEDYASRMRRTRSTLAETQSSIPTPKRRARQAS